VAIAGTTTGHRGDDLVAMHVPFVDLRRQAEGLRADFDAVFRSVVERAAYTMGPELAQFEEVFARFCGCDHAIGVSSGTDAVKLALLAAGVQPGDDVVVPANTFIATAEAVSHLGATPVFVDCLEGTGLMDPAAIGPAVTPRPTAVVPVHLYGQTVDMDAVFEAASRHGLAVVEDACQAHGATYKGRPAGSLGITAAFSFYPGKNLGALGDGGAVTTNDPAAADTVRLYRNHGQTDRYTHQVVGYCDRLHNLQAALLLLKMRHLAAWNDARRAAARDYDSAMVGMDGVAVTEARDGNEVVYHLYVVTVDERERIRERLGELGVESGVHYPVPLHIQPAYAKLGYAQGDFPVAERRAARMISLPMFPEITREQRAYVVASLAEAMDPTDPRGGEGA
jgi:dTDP-4-amino-4,6-dideoxygalactose transaminase